MRIWVVCIGWFLVGFMFRPLVVSHQNSLTCPSCPVCVLKEIPAPVTMRKFPTGTAFWETHIAYCPSDMREVYPSRRERDIVGERMGWSIVKTLNWEATQITCIPDGVGRGVEQK